MAKRVRTFSPVQNVWIEQLDRERYTVIADISTSYTKSEYQLLCGQRSGYLPGHFYFPGHFWTQIQDGYSWDWPRIPQIPVRTAVHWAIRYSWNLLERRCDACAPKSPPRGALRALWGTPANKSQTNFDLKVPKNAVHLHLTNLQSMQESNAKDSQHPQNGRVLRNSETIYTNVFIHNFPLICFYFLNVFTTKWVSVAKWPFSFC